MIANKEPLESAKEVWEFGKKLGMVSKGNEEEVVSKLEKMEVRERLVSGRADVSLGWES